MAESTILAVFIVGSLANLGGGKRETGVGEYGVSSVAPCDTVRTTRVMISIAIQLATMVRRISHGPAP